MKRTNTRQKNLTKSCFLEILVTLAEAIKKTKQQKERKKEKRMKEKDYTIKKHTSDKGILMTIIYNLNFKI